MKNVKKGGKCEFAAHRMNDQYTQEVDQSACSASTHFAQKNGYSVGGHGSAVVAKRLGPVDKRDSQGALIVIQAGICDGDQLGTRPYVGRGMGVP